MPPYVLDSLSLEKPTSLGDSVGDIVHVGPQSYPTTTQNGTITTVGWSTAGLERDHGTTKKAKPLVSSMCVARKEGRPTQRVSRAKKGKRVHSCDQPGCEKIFTRAEHLRRHQLNHSTEVYFRCDICDRTFVRHDLLLRHHERHATQAVKILALAQRHGNLPNHYGINRPQGLTTLPQSGNGYNGSGHAFNTHGHRSGERSLDHQLTSNSLTPSPVPSQASVPNLLPVYAAKLHIGHDHGYASMNSSSSPIRSTGRAELQCQLTQSVLQRQHELYAMSASWDSNIDWLMDGTVENSMIDEFCTVNYMQPLDIAYNCLIAHPPLEISNSNPSGTRDNLIFHPMDENMRQEILLLLGGGSKLQTSNFASLNSMQHYLQLYWNSFHVRYPVLHRPSFVPGLSLVYLAAIVVAIGASYATSDGYRFSMALYKEIRAVLINTNDFPTCSPNNLPVLQTLFLTDIFGKLHSNEMQFAGVQLDIILVNILRQEGPPTDSLERLRVLQRDGMDYHLESEWHHWILLEGRKRISILSFWFDVQQAVIFGRETCQTVFDLQTGLPSGKEAALWESNCASNWLTRADPQAYQPHFLGILRILFDQKKRMPLISPLSSTFILQGLISVSLDLKQSEQRHSDAGIEKQARVLQAYERWRLHYEKTVAIHLRPSCHNKVMVMYHMAFITMHTNLQHVYALAGDTRQFSRSVERSDYYQAKTELSQWANSPSGQLATWHAIQIIVRILGEPDLVQEHVHMPWMQYTSILMCWAYGALSHSPLAGDVDSGCSDFLWNTQASKAEMQGYLQQMNTCTWQELVHARNFRRTAGMMASVKCSWEAMGLRWSLLEQASETIRDIISRNLKVV